MRKSCKILVTLVKLVTLLAKLVKLANLLKLKFNTPDFTRYSQCALVERKELLCGGLLTASSYVRNLLPPRSFDETSQL